MLKALLEWVCMHVCFFCGFPLHRVEAMCSTYPWVHHVAAHSGDAICFIFPWVHHVAAGSSRQASRQTVVDTPAAT